MRPGLLRNRKFIRLARAVDGQALALGSLELLWSAAYESGDEVLGTGEDVEALADWRGDPGVLFAALRDAGSPDRSGFIEEIPERPGVFGVHDLWDHAPDYVRKRRSRESERQARGAALREVADADRSMTGQRPANGRTPAPAPAPAPAQEEASSEPKAAPEPELPLDASPVVAVFPCVGAGAKEFPITEAQCAEWARAFPGVDVPGQVRRMAVWLQASPAKRKTARGVPAFVIRWLGRAQDQGGSASMPAAHLAPAPAAPHASFKGGTVAL